MRLKPFQAAVLFDCMIKIMKKKWMRDERSEVSRRNCCWLSEENSCLVDTGLGNRNDSSLTQVTLARGAIFMSLVRWSEMVRTG